jgi:hypothetical protein
VNFSSCELLDQYLVAHAHCVLVAYSSFIKKMVFGGGGCGIAFIYNWPAKSLPQKSYFEKTA